MDIRIRDEEKYFYATILERDLLLSLPPLVLFHGENKSFV